ncbi:MAG: putative two-component response regulator receiver protein [Anaerolineales bacterium]|jgi:CheY-like chemotaxis protein|nr:putative two-component response regulator receiver protein [Anaerolineales bacterium]MBM2847090.1 putative two-component response regulator receiver protein [Anaerolineales bacterium]
MAKILVAEDEPDIRDLIVFILRMLGGYEVVAANNGEEAVQLAFKEIPDLILTDVRMPKMSGYEACQRIKAEPTTKHIPVVFLTARGQEQEVQAGIAAGGDEYLLKPFEQAQLLKKVADILTQAKKA